MRKGKMYRIEYDIYRNKTHTFCQKEIYALNAKEAREIFDLEYDEFGGEKKPHPFHIQVVPMKEYFILPTDLYGQPNGDVRPHWMTKEEYEECRKTEPYVYDNFNAAWYRAMD